MTEKTQTAPGQRTDEGAAATQELVTAVGRLKVWLIVLTVLVTLLVAAAIAAAILVPRAIDDQQDVAYSEPIGPTADQVASTREEIETALGDSLEGLDVRLVTMTFDDPSMPADAPDEEQFIYVQYRLKDSGVVVADIVGGPFGPDPTSMGMLPTQGSLQSRMTPEQFDRLLAAYADETAAPLGNVRRYNDRSEMMMPGAVQDDSVRVGETKYEASDLWAATEGMTVEGDTIGMDVWAPSRKALIFYEDPETGDFTYLGTEPALGGY
jgi:hypothetical protein